MGRISIAAFKPKPGKEKELLAVLAARLPLLQRLRLATRRPDVTMRSNDGVIIQVSEWVDDDSIRRAHSTPEVLVLWNRFEACCRYVKLDSIAEAHEDFATFEAIGALP